MSVTAVAKTEREIAPGYEEVVNGAIPALIDQIDAEMAARRRA